MSSEQDRNFQSDPDIPLLRKIALDKIEAYQGAQPSQLESELGLVQDTVSLLRDRLIEYYRGMETPTMDSELGQALGKVNMALSLVVGVEYPASGIHRNLLDEAGKLLKDLPGLEDMR